MSRLRSRNGRLAFAFATAIAALAGCSLLLDESRLTGGVAPPGDAGPADVVVPIPEDGAACSADTARDPRHCGRCGHDCLGGGCDLGRCVPVPLTTGEATLDELRTAGSKAVYRSGDKVRAVEIDGGLPVSLTQTACISNGSATRGLAVSDDGFYKWCFCTLQFRRFDDGGQRNSVNLCGGSNAAFGNGVVAYQEGSDLKTLRGDLDGAPSSSFTTETGGFLELVMQGNLVFYMSTKGTLGYAALTGGAKGSLETNQPSPGGIAIDALGIFWITGTDGTSGMLKTRPTSGGVATTLASGLDHPARVAVDDRYAYVTLKGTPPDYADGRIVRVPRVGGAVELVASGVVLPNEIVAIDQYLLFTSLGPSADGKNYPSGTVFRVAK